MSQEERDELPVPESTMEYDVVTYVGEVHRSGYEVLCDNLSEFQTPGVRKAFVIPITYGGDPSAGYRIARALSHAYPDELIAVIPDVCKSAGTLMCVGMKELVICDRGELGPLDIQLSKKDELFELSSGLDIAQAINALQTTSQEIFREMLIDLKVNGGIGTKLAAELASNITTGLLSPIASQIDPIKLGEHQRAMNIATAYGKRLNRKFKNTTDRQISRLITDYPAHSFVIDRKEAGELFSRVRAPTDLEESIAEATLDVAAKIGFNPASRPPTVTVASTMAILRYLESINHEEKEQPHGRMPTDGQSNEGSAEGHPGSDEGHNPEEGSAEAGAIEASETAEKGSK